MRSAFVIVGAVLAAGVGISSCDLMDCDPDWETCDVPDAGSGGGAGGSGGSGGGGGGAAGSYCTNCTDHSQCGGANDFCVRTTGPTFCGQDCSGGKACPAGAYCASITDSYGANLGFNCVPDTSCGGSGGGGGGGGSGGGSGGGGGGGGSGGSCGPACYTSIPDCQPSAPCTYELDMSTGSVRTCYANGVKSQTSTSGSTTTMRYTKNGTYCYDVEVAGSVLRYKDSGGTVFLTMTPQSGNLVTVECGGLTETIDTTLCGGGSSGGMSCAAGSCPP